MERTPSQFDASKQPKVATRVRVAQTTKLQIGVLALVSWAALAFTGNLGLNSFLIMFSATSLSVQLTWTAPGDDGTVAGTAGTSYDIRYASQMITEATWATATQVS